MRYTTGEASGASIDSRMIDQERIGRAVEDILRAIGDDPRRVGLEKTPARVAAMYAELFSGIDQDPRDLLTVSYEEGVRDMVTVRDIPFASICEHHLLPFFGTVHIAYIPSGGVVGISKLARAIECLGRRPQMQERLTNQAADILTETLKPEGTAVRVEAEHLCMTIRGVRAPGSRVITTAYRGAFKDDPAVRAEFLSLTSSKGAGA